MAKWNDGVITNAGISLLGEVIAGGEINITRAALGGGTVDEAALMAQTALSIPLSVSPVIAAKKLVEGKGIEIRIQIRNDGLTEDKIMKQVGLYAKLNSGDEVLFAIMQDDTGEEIPSETSYPDFMLEFTAAIAVSNTDNITVSVSGGAVVTRDDLNQALAGKADKNYVDEALKGKSDTDHTHDERYYTESETDALLNGKADKSDIPTSLPADGGNADTVDGKHASDFMQNLGFLTTGSLLDYVLTMTESGYLFVSGSVTDTPVSGQFFFVDVRRYAGGHYAITATRFNAGGVYTNRYNNNSDTKRWYGWDNVADGGNAATVGGAAVVTSAALGLHRIASGTDEATTTNCPAGCWYGRHS